MRYVVGGRCPWLSLIEADHSLGGSLVARVTRTEGTVSSA
jgi:hypothetical protein